MTVDDAAQSIDGTLGKSGIDIPLLGCVHKTHSAAGSYTHSTLYNLNSRGLLITEYTLVPV